MNRVQANCPFGPRQQASRQVLVSKMIPDFGYPSCLWLTHELPLCRKFLAVPMPGFRWSIWCREIHELTSIHWIPSKIHCFFRMFFLTEMNEWFRDKTKKTVEVTISEKSVTKQSRSSPSQHSLFGGRSAPGIALFNKKNAHPVEFPTSHPADIEAQMAQRHRIQ